jgi:DNA-binding response OmpR family regulator
MDRYQAEYGGTRLDLTRTEFDLLCILVREQHRVLSRDYIHRQLWAPGNSNSRVVDTFVSRLRTKLRAAGHPGIAVLRSRGYRLLQEDEPF